MTVKLTGTICIPVAEQAKFLPLLDDHIAASRAEAGCIRFDINRDETDPDLFQLSEEFVDEAAFAHHQARGGASPWGIQSVDLERDFRKSIEP